MIVTLLTDYGRDDDFAGVCHGVIRQIAPDCRIVDITHGIPRHDVRRGALVLRNTLPYMPAGVHVAIVDPQVGTERRALALRCADGRMLVGPDNGLLSLAWEQAGGVDLAVDVSRSPHRLEPVSATFHGRDVFSPVAGHLAAGAELADAGDPIEPDDLMHVLVPTPFIDGDALVAHVLVIDRFGNASLDATHDDLAGTGLQLGTQVEIQTRGERFHALFAQSFADVQPGEVLLYEDAYRTLAIAINRGDAAGALQLATDAEVRIVPR